jgi:hypothetical protein
LKHDFTQYSLKGRFFESLYSFVQEDVVDVVDAGDVGDAGFELPEISVIDSLPNQDPFKERRAKS